MSAAAELAPQIEPPTSDVDESDAIEWVLRPYDEDVDGSDFYYLPSIAYTRSRAGFRAGASRAGQRRNPSPRGEAERKFFASYQAEHGRPHKDAPLTEDEEHKIRGFMEAHRPIWLWLLKNADVTLAVDRSSPHIVWGWIITSGPRVIHSLGVKRAFIKAGIGQEIALDLIGDRWTEYQVCTMELPQLQVPTSQYKSSDLLCLRKPSSWSLDPTWLLTRMVGR